MINFDQIKTEIQKMCDAMASYSGFPRMEVNVTEEGRGRYLYVQWNGKEPAIQQYPYPWENQENWLLHTGWSVSAFIGEKLLKEQKDALELEARKQIGLVAGPLIELVERIGSLCPEGSEGKVKITEAIKEFKEEARKVEIPLP